MLGHIGFSYIGLIYLLMLFIPNIIWSRHIPADYTAAHEHKALVLLERIGQVGCTVSVLFFRDYDTIYFSGWDWWLYISLALMIAYEFCWIRYFTQGRTNRLFYQSYLGVPMPLATLPVLGFLCLGIYGQVIWLILFTFILGIGHIGIHWQHVQQLK